MKETPKWTWIKLQVEKSEEPIESQNKQTTLFKNDHYTHFHAHFQCISKCSTSWQTQILEKSAYHWVLSLCKNIPRDKLDVLDRFCAEKNGFISVACEKSMKSTRDLKLGANNRFANVAKFYFLILCEKV